MIKGARKDDLKQIASELNLEVNEKNTLWDIIELIKNSEPYKENSESVKEIADLVIEERKRHEQSEVEIEKLKLELEVAKAHAEIKNTSCEGESQDSLETLIKSVRTLTVKLLTKQENWGFFFSSLERAFSTKNVPEKYKAEILLNLLGERASNVITYIKDDDLSDYLKVKDIVLREFQPTPSSCLENFRKATRNHNETYIMFASRLTTNFDYYLKLRDVSDFESLKQLIVSDKLRQTLDRETASFISVRESDKWFRPDELGKEVDLYYTSRGKTTPENYAGHKNSNVRNVSNVFLSDVKSIKKRHHKTLHFHKTDEWHQPVSAERNKQENRASGDSQNRGWLADAVNAPSRGGEHSLNVNAPDFVQGSSLTFMSNNCNKQHSVLLSTAVCYLIDESGKQVCLHCLLDAGSQMSFLKRDCVEMLGLKKEKTNILVSGLNDSSIPIKSQVTAIITNENKSYVQSLNFLVVPKITAGLTPSNKFDVSIGDFSNIKLADEKFNVPERVDMLLGVEVFYELLRPGQISLPNSNLLLQNTVFGFIVSGGIPRENENVIHCGFLNQEINLDQTLKQFWEIENVESDIPKSRESILCEEHFQNNHSRDKSGRYIIKMPLKENPDCLGKSRHIALKKLNSLWNRFVKDPELLTLYSNFMHEYLELGHMYEIKEIEEKSGSYYIPHLGVFRPESKTSPP
ncbi:hypothetical protein AVEN_104994-1 [Araneus ventricosus]|uniref:Uncharacterized protein n=1 Tax=Araneus ventricosus TaxID=182803 RepID=A0A4Y2UE97_ARAVE|nr:hypothetical protein AVEN_17882-1 [Araneus ventricosus]GBO10846.1 hypothetical protein AVEN_104994-1 [Araneus ventricosus]